MIKNSRFKNKYSSLFATSLVIGSLVVAFGIACGKKSSFPTSYNPGKYSTATGVAFNKGEDAFEVTKFKGQSVPPGMVYVPGGMTVIGSYDESALGNKGSRKRKVTIPPLFVKKTLVVNIEWLEYLHDLEVNSTEEKYEAALPDNTVWARDLAYNDPYIDNYCGHPGFYFFPCVGISWQQAEDYCAWLTEVLNKKCAGEAGYAYGEDAELDEEDDEEDIDDFGIEEEEVEEEDIDAKVEEGADEEEDDVDQEKPADFNENQEENEDESSLEEGEPSEDAENANEEENADLDEEKRTERKKKRAELKLRATGVLLPARIRLLTEAEWEYVARGRAGGTQETETRDQDQRIYPWSGLSVRHQEGTRQGKFRAKFKQGPGDYGGGATTYVFAYEPNEFGLYDMGGNAREFTRDVFRESSFEIVEDFNPIRRDGTYDEKEDYVDTAPEITDELRVVKGASWRTGPRGTGERDYIHINETADDVSFRYAMTSAGE